MKSIPKEVADIATTLTKAGFKAYLVGGSVRDMLLGFTPKDWDIATNAKPDEIQKLFSDSVYENTFGTVGVKTRSEDSTLAVIEVTTFRKEGIYSDNRHPDEVSFAQTIEEDLARRDFTVNAIALNLQMANGKWPASPKTASRGEQMTITDPYDGQKDLENKIIRAVGAAEKRFTEDALRLMRAVRLATQLAFVIDAKTAEALLAKSALIKNIAYERVRDEFTKLVLTPWAHDGIRLLLNVGLLAPILPELCEGVGVGQNKHHIYTVFEHNVRALQYAAENNFSLELRLASLFHDVGKPRTKAGEGYDSTFYGHQVVGARMARKLLERLKYSIEVIEKVSLLVREHMFVYDPEVVTLRGVRRLIHRVGVENVDDLLKLREADRIGSGVPKAQPYRLRHLKAMIEKVKMDPISPKMLGVNGTDIMNLLGVAPGPIIGYIVAILLEEVLDDPAKNDRATLEARVRELGALPIEELRALSMKAKQSAEDAQNRIDDELKEKYFVK